MTDLQAFTIEPMTLQVFNPVATYRCPECGGYNAFFDEDPESFLCGGCNRSVTPHADG